MLTARYALRPYTKQIRFVFKVLIILEYTELTVFIIFTSFAQLTQKHTDRTTAVF
jgi:hypothetical protein